MQWERKIKAKVGTLDLSSQNKNKLITYEVFVFLKPFSMHYQPEMEPKLLFQKSFRSI